MFTAGSMSLPVSLDAGSKPGGAESGTRTGKREPMDEVRFETFYRRNAGSVWSYLYRLTGNSATADDLLQKTFFRFLRAKPVLASDEHMRGWIFRTATHLAMDHFREARREWGTQTTGEPSVSTEPRDALRHDMMKTFGELKPRERALLWLAHVEEADHEDIGEALGVKRDSVKVLLFRARKRLGELLTRKGLGPEVKR